MSPEVLTAYEATCKARAECRARIHSRARRASITFFVALALTFALVLL